MTVERLPVLPRSFSIKFTTGFLKIVKSEWRQVLQPAASE